MNKKIFSLDELRAITDAGYHAKKNNDFDWIKYALATEDGQSAYDKYFFNLTDHGQDYFEDCMDVAVRDCEDLYPLLESPNETDERKSRINSDINGWIEAAFEEFLE